MKLSKSYSLIILLSALLLSACSEELPQYVEPEIPMTVTFDTNPHSILVTGLRNPRAVAFDFNIIHQFDEVLEDKHYFWGGIDVWVTDKPELRNHIDIFDSRPGLMYTIQPEIEKTYTVYWDQILENDLKLWYFYDSKQSVFNMTAKAELQIYRRFNIQKFDSINFVIGLAGTESQKPVYKNHIPEWIPKLFKFPNYSIIQK
jgi:hypothetical protein